MLVLVLAGIYASLDDESRLLTPRILRLEPDSGRPGEIITARGQGLDRSRVEDLSLTSGDRYLLVHIIGQSDSSIVFRIPASATPGAYRILIHPVSRSMRALEQEVKLMVK
jgi:hypothetical protein